MIPKYQQLADALRKQLTAGAFGGTGKLPTEEKLRGLYGVSRQTVRQALAVLEEEGLIRRRQGSGAYATGLHPDSAHNQIAVLLPSDSDYTYARLRSGLLVPLTKEGFAVSFYLTGYSIAKERLILESLCEKPPRGMIVEPVKNALPNPCLDLYERLWEQQCATVFLHGGYENFPPRPVLLDDDVGGGYLLAERLLALRHTRIGAVLCCDTRAGAHRYLGFARACAEAGVPCEDGRIGWYTSDQLFDLQKKQDTGFLADYISKKLGSCSAVICQDDEIAYWLVRELTHAGFHVPQDVSVAGFDNSFLCKFCEPALTSLARRPPETAGAAANALLALLRAERPAPVNFRWELIVRESTVSLS